MCGQCGAKFGTAHSSSCPELRWPDGQLRGVMRDPDPLPPFEKDPAKREAKMLEIKARGGTSPASVGERMRSIF